MSLTAGTMETAAADGVFARFKLVEPSGTNYFVQLSGNIHVDPWYLPQAVWPAGVQTNPAQRIVSGQFTDWFDIQKWAGS